MFAHLGRTMAKIFEDLTSIYGGARELARAMHEDLTQVIATRIDEIMARHNFVTREEFEIVRDMVSEARAENEALRKELSALKRRRAPRGTGSKQST